MDTLVDELLLNILEFTASSIEYTKICKSLYKEPEIPHMLRVHARVEVDDNGTIRTYLDGKKHSFNDEPAVIYTDRIKFWFKNGKCHRDNDKPAMIWFGEQSWYQDGKKHRENDKPAVINSNGIQKWFINNKYHRDNDLPALISENGSQFWYQNGKKHRDNDLPAVIYPDGIQKWFIKGKFIKIKYE